MKKKVLRSHQILDGFLLRGALGHELLDDFEAVSVAFHLWIVNFTGTHFPLEAGQISQESGVRNTQAANQKKLVTGYLLSRLGLFLALVRKFVIK